MVNTQGAWGSLCSYNSLIFFQSDKLLQYFLICCRTRYWYSETISGHESLLMLFNRWTRSKIARKDIEKENMCVVAAAENNPFAGPVSAVFRFVIHAWMKICGDLPVVGLAGSAPIAVH